MPGFFIMMSRYNTNSLFGHRGHLVEKPGSFPYFNKRRPLSQMIILKDFFDVKTKPKNQWTANQQIQANNTIHVVAPLQSLNLLIEQSTHILVMDWEFFECSWLKISAIYRTHFFLIDRTVLFFLIHFISFSPFFSSDVIPSNYCTNASWL